MPRDRGEWCGKVTKSPSRQNLLTAEKLHVGVDCRLSAGRCGYRPRGAALTVRARRQSAVVERSEAGRALVAGARAVEDVVHRFHMRAAVRSLQELHIGHQASMFGRTFSVNYCPE